MFHYASEGFCLQRVVMDNIIFGFQVFNTPALSLITHSVNTISNTRNAVHSSEISKFVKHKHRTCHVFEVHHTLILRTASSVAEELWVLKYVTVCTRTVVGISTREIPTSLTASTANWRAQNSTQYQVLHIPHFLHPPVLERLNKENGLVKQKEMYSVVGSQWYILYAFFWVIPRRLKFIYRRFGNSVCSNFIVR